MVYIHVKRVGNKNYYTLRISYRGKEGRVITKDLENLGSDITKIKIENLEKKYKKEIRQSYRALKRFLESGYYLEKAKKKKLKKSDFFNKKQLEEIEAVRLHFENKFLKLDELTQKEIYEMFLIKFAVSSTAIEGNTINLQQADRLLTENILPKNKTLREVYDLQNTKKVFFDLFKKKPKLSLEMIEKTHDGLLKNIDKRKGYRTYDLRILGEPFKPSPGRYVKADIRLLLKWHDKNKKKIHPLALAILFHHKFENIHPFADGNGRTGRILMNLILLKNEYPPLIISETLREEYLQVMSKADQEIKKDLFSTKMKNYQSLVYFLVDEFKKTYWNTFLI
jgi:prophage maintenance system killer protein